MDEGDQMKKTLIISLIGFVIGIIVIFLGHKTIQVTGELPFCGSCHVMKPMEASYLNDVHSGKGKKGIKTSCVSCHLPHDNMMNYLFTKAYNGTKEVFLTAIGQDEKIDWIEKTKHREKFVYDSGCISCHSNLKADSLKTKAEEMHQRYFASKGSLSCVSCHKHVGHSQLRGELNKVDPQKYPLNK